MNQVVKFDDKKMIAHIRANLNAKTPKTEFLTINPAIAAFLLELNWDKNRVISQLRVNTYAASMRENNWDVTGESICLTREGTVIDGQHRLWAVIESGATIVTAVTFGLEPEVYRSIDRGMNRTMAYCANMSTQQAAALNFILKLAYGPEECNVANLNAMDGVYGEAVQKIISLQSKQLRVVRQGGVVAAAALWIKANRESYVCDVYAAMIALDSSSLPPVGRAFLRQCVLANTVTGKQIAGLQLFLRAFKTFDPEYSDVQKLTFKDGTATLDIARSMIKKAVDSAGVSFGKDTIRTQRPLSTKKIGRGKS